MLPGRRWTGIAEVNPRKWVRTRGLLREPESLDPRIGPRRKWCEGSTAYAGRSTISLAGVGSISTISDSGSTGYVLRYVASRMHQHQFSDEVAAELKQAITDLPYAAVSASAVAAEVDQTW